MSVRLNILGCGYLASPSQSVTDAPIFLDVAVFRNLLMYRHERIDDAVVYGLFRKRLGDFEAFADLIKAWVARARP